MISQKDREKRKTLPIIRKIITVKHNTNENSKNLCDTDATQLNKCRICLKVGQIPIFGNEDVDDISADVIAIGNIEICLDDNLPKFLCNYCLNLLQAAMLFRNTAKQSDQLLRQSKEEIHINYSQYLNTTTKCSNNLSLEPLKLENKSDSVQSVELDHINDENIKESSSLSQLKQEIDSTESFRKMNLFQDDDHNHAAIQKTHSITNIVISPKKELKISMKDEYENDNFEHINNDININDCELVQRYHCETCNIPFQSSEEYRQHNNSTDHKKTKRYSSKIECEICNKRLSRPYFKQHLALHNADGGNEDMKRKCPICNKLYSKTYYQDHIVRTHSTERKKPRPQVRVQCPVCNKSYEKQYYKFHLAIHTSNTSKYVCDMCGKSFIQQSAFKRHRLIHGSDLAFKCQLCPYRGRHPGLVKTHMRTHTRDQYQYQCTQCSACFLTKSNLNKHVQRHKGPVDFKCETCKRGFYSKLDLERHFEADHLGVKNHVCNICGKAFGYRNAMMNHQLKVHKREKLTNGRGRRPLYLEVECKNLDNVKQCNLEKNDSF